MTYEQAWLDYKPDDRISPDSIPHRIHIVQINSSDEYDKAILKSAADEYITAVKSITGTTCSAAFSSDTEATDGLILRCDNSEVCDFYKRGSYSIDSERDRIIIESSDASGILYGVFHLLRLIRTHAPLEQLHVTEHPVSPFRMLNHWDNMDGSIERGYSGKSFFFADGKILGSDRIHDYARLVASVGINAVAINNVNVRGEAKKLITDEYRQDVIRIKKVFDEYGIKLFISLNYASPIDIGGLDTADPCDTRVAEWWKSICSDIYRDMPNFGGFLVKADSEGRPGPFTYGRDHADGANVIADAIAPFGGVLIWRCFVYNCKQDWRDIITDRAKAQFDNFRPLDGMFHDNVILQVKNGPMDFQIREPVSPLFGGLYKTNEMIEFQIAQEYTGQQKDVCFLIPEFKEVLSFKTFLQNFSGSDTVLDIVTGKTFGNLRCGMVAVANTGDDSNWTGSDLAAANLYGFGRLSFDPELSAEEIVREWTSLTFGDDPRIIEVVTDILLRSREVYEKYTSPLGIGWMINPGYHYGPNIDGYEYSQWGTYHRADHWGIGVERGSTGTGYVKQYNEPNASMYDMISSCPEELLLFFHYIPYTHVLKSGKTLIQHIYDSHFEGAADVEDMIAEWESIKGLVPDKIYDRVHERFDMQLANAYEWRDTVNSYFYRKSSIKDLQNRVFF